MMRAGGICGSIYAVLALALFIIMFTGTKKSNFHQNAMKPMDLDRDFDDIVRDWAIEPIMDIGLSNNKPC